MLGHSIVIAGAHGDGQEEGELSGVCWGGGWGDGKSSHKDFSQLMYR